MDLSGTTLREIAVRRLGVVRYDEALALQKSLVEERKAGRIPDQLLLLQHPPVITLGVKTRNDRGHIVASDEELSETERQIVELVVAGRRNSEVAAELSLSPNTVAWNLSKVYRKLGVSSRTELVARVGGTPHK